MPDEPFATPSNTREEILAATYRSLREHGYADLTIEKIGREFEKSPSLVYHHFDDKDDLVLAMLDSLLDSFETTVIDEAITGTGTDTDAGDGTGTAVETNVDTTLNIECTDVSIEDPRGRLEEIIEWTFGPPDAFENVPTFATLFELRARATHHEAYRRHFTRSDRVLKRYFEAIVTAGIEQQCFQDCDPDAVANTLLLFAAGATLRRSTVENESSWLDDVQAEVMRYLEHRVFKEQGK